MRVPRVQFTVRRMIELILFVALILGLAIQSHRAARREHELAQLERAFLEVLDELRAAREIISREVLAREERAKTLLPAADK
jgi:hypothetical protein